jgi:mono/diheme cytochrome c family protein
MIWQLLTASALCSVPLLRAGTAEELFTKNCAPCHGKDGKGNTPAGKKAGAKDLTISKTTRAEIEKQITDGKIDPKRKTNMPAFGEKVSKEEIRTLTDFVIAFRKGG